MSAILSVYQQQRVIQSFYPKAHTEIESDPDLGAVLIVTITLQAVPAFESYEVQICYCVGFPPHVILVNPQLVLEREGKRTPHLYGDNSLCLYDPAKNEWTAADAIAHTIIPWTLEWLFHYENWLCTGIWRGDGPVESAPPSDTSIDLATEGKS